MIDKNQKVDILNILTTVFFQLVLFTTMILLLAYTFVHYQKSNQDFVLNFNLTLCYCLFTLSIFLGLKPCGLISKDKKEEPPFPHIFLSLRLDKLENKFERVENLIDELNEKARPKIKRRKRKEIKHD